MNSRIAVQGEAGFDDLLSRLERRGESDFSSVEPVVKEVVDAVRREGDTALLRYIERFEQRRPQSLLIRDYGGAKALAELPAEVAGALKTATERIRSYHERQAADVKSFEYEQGGVRLGGRVQAVLRAGIYVPGGKASYPSSVLMCAVPARVAGVEEIIVACPNTGPAVLAACHLSGVDAVLDAGGAQAIAALAYGTESVPRVDKIVGPGNAYVAAAKRIVFGEVDIDSIAGPSEILVIADETADAAVVAADLLSQAEHDEAAYPLLLTTSRDFAAAVAREVDAQLVEQPRRKIAEVSMREHGFSLVVRDRAEIVKLANRLAAEHVSVQTRAPRELADQIRAAGAIFIGSATPEAAGDYLAGPSHVLPTGGAARYAAPLGVYDFVSRTSIIEYTKEALSEQAGAITAFARAEGLEAHARAVEIRSRRG